MLSMEPLFPVALGTRDGDGKILAENPVGILPLEE